MDTSLLSQMNYYRPKLKLDMERLLQLMGEKKGTKKDIERLHKKTTV